MKKTILILAAVLIVVGGFLTWNQRNDATAAPAPAATPAPSPAAEAAEPAEAEPTPAIPEVHGLDYEALHALHADDETVVTLAGQTADWKLFYDMLHSYGLQVEDYFAQMASYYQIAPDWNGSAGNGMSFAQYVSDQAKSDLTSMLLIRAFSAEHGVTLGEAELEALTPDALAAKVLGEGATVEDLRETLESRVHMKLENYVETAVASALFRKCYTELYGENGEKISEEDAVAYLEDQDYLSAAHILLMTIDPMTGETLDDETVAQKKAQAAALVEELRAIEDREALLKRFAELKEQYCEDGGKVSYPDGYTFTPGTMVKEFENAVLALENYGVSDPVESSYGLHIILRLPLSGESLLYSSKGTPSTAREEMAVTHFTADVDGFLSEHPAEFAADLENLDLTQYVKAD